MAIILFILTLVTSHYVICDCAQNLSNSLPVFLNNSLNQSFTHLNELNEQRLNVQAISEILEKKVNEIRNNELGISLIQVRFTDTFMKEALINEKL